MRHVLELGRAGSAGTGKRVRPVLRDGVVVATLRAAHWKEAATAVVDDRERVLAEDGPELISRWPAGTARLRARQTSWWRGTWDVDIEEPVLGRRDAVIAGGADGGSDGGGGD